MYDDLRIRLRSLFRRNRSEQELDDELRFHTEHEIEERVAKGMNRDEAAREVRLLFGGMDQIKEECRQARGVTVVENIVQDTRQALRSLRKHPTFAAGAILTLALGVTATTVAFSVLNSIVLNPVPFKEPDRLVEIYSWSKTGGGPYQSMALFQGWRQQTHLFDQVEAHSETSLALTGAAEPETVNVSQVTTGLFGFLGVQPQIGRDFQQGDPESKVALISHALWVRRFASSPQVLGSTLKLNDDVFTIAGVMPDWFRFPLEGVQVWTSFDPSKPTPQTPRRGASVIARLRKGMPLAEADAQVAMLATRIDASLSQRPGATSRIVPLNPYSTESFLFARSSNQKTRTTLFLILGAAVLVLLASCANSANLFLSRATARTREIAVRAAIGGSRIRLAGHMLTEAVVVAIFAGGLGMIFASWSLRGLSLILPLDIARRSLRPLGLDWRVALCAAAASMIAGLIAATLPALRATRNNVPSSLRTQIDSGRRADVRFRGTLVVIEAALALILVISAGLMSRTLWVLTHVDSGWSPDGFMVVEPRLPASRYATPAARNAAMTQLFERLKTLPGVQSAATAEWVPLLPSSISFGTFETETTSIPRGIVSTNRVSDDYFQTLGIPFVAGRTFSPSDDPNSAVIPADLSTRLWPGGNPLGRRFRLTGVFDWVTVIGVVGSVQTVSYDRPTEQPEVYRPFVQGKDITAPRYIAIKTNPDADVSKSIRSAIHQVDPDLPVDIRTIETIYRGTLAQPVFQALLFGGFAFLTVLLVIAGVYAVITYEVSRKTHEIGVRVALGATRGAVISEVMGRTLYLAGIGVAVGVVACLALTRLLISMLYGIQPTDPSAFAGGIVLLIAFVSIAAYLPARRAARIEPAIALRVE